MTVPDPMLPLLDGPTVRAQLADVAERAVKTFAQALLAYFAVGSLDAFHTDWGNALSLACGAAILSVLSSLASLPVGVPGSASATSAVALAVDAAPLVPAPAADTSPSMGPDLP